MSPDGRVLEENVAALMRRAYVPALPRAEFRRSALTLARDEAQGRRAARPRRLLYLVPAAAAAAAAVLAFWIGLRSGAGGAPSPVPTPAGIVARGEVALRFAGDPGWRAASGEERSSGLTLAAGPAVEVETPSAVGLDARATDALAALAPASRARFTPLPDEEFGDAGPGCGVELSTGGLALALGPRADTWWLATEVGLVRVAPESALEADRAGGSTSVRLERGAAVLERLDGSQVELAVGAQVTLDADLLAPAGETGGRQPAAVADAEPAVASAGDVETAPEAAAPPAGAVLRGRVHDETGEPLARFRVLLLREAEVPDISEPLFKDFESGDGAYVWEGIPPERYEVFVEADGFAQHRSGVLKLAAGEPRELDVALAAGRALRGWVLDEETEVPLPGATVVVESEVPSQVLPVDLSKLPEYVRRVARAGDDGGFLLTDLGPGTHRLRVTAAGHAPEWMSAEVPAGGTVPDVFARLGPGGGIAGVVMDADGRPLAGSMLLASFAGARVFSFEQTVTDAEGRYAFEHLAPGIHMLIRWDSVEKAESATPDSIRPAMVAAGKVATVDFRADRPALRVTGRFLDAAGQPIPFLKFTLLREEANNLEGVDQWHTEMTDAQGAYSAQLPEAGMYFVFATYSMGERLTLVDAIEVTADVPELVRDVRVPETHAVCTVLRADDRRPVANALLFALKLDAAGQTTFAGKTTADAAGVGVFDGLAPGRYFLTAASADAADLGQAATQPFDLAAGEEPRALEVLLPEGGVLRARVIDRFGKPVENARLALSTERGGVIEVLVDPITDRDGRLSIPGLSPGMYTATAACEGFAPAKASAEVRAALGADLLIQLEPLD